MNPVWFILKLIVYLLSVAAIGWLVGFLALKFFYQVGKESLEDILAEVNARYLIALVKPLVYLLSVVGALQALDLQRLAGSRLVVSYRYSYGFNEYLMDLFSMFRASVANISLFVIVFFSLIVVFRVISFYKDKK